MASRAATAFSVGRQSSGKRSIAVLPQATEDITVKWALRTLTIITALSIICIGCQAWIMANQVAVRQDLTTGADSDSDLDSIRTNFNIEITFHSVFLAAVGFWWFITWNGLMRQNTIQIISVNFYNVGLFIYSITQIFQLRNDLEQIRPLLADPKLANGKPLFLAAQILLPVMIGIFIPIYIYLTIRLSAEFGWRIYRISGGDIAVERLLLDYHIFLLLMKYGIVFMVGFTVLDLALASVSFNGLILIPVLGGLLGIAISSAGFLGVRRENAIVLSVFIAGSVLEFVYITFRVYLAYARSTDFANNIQRAELPFLMFAEVSLVILAVSILYGVVCYRNFGMGLKEVLDAESKLRNGEQEMREIDLDA